VFSEDPRLALLERSWFTGKRCMDVGCNEGLVTLGIAMKFGSRSMVGVDIDEHLIKRACIHLREERSRAVVRAAEARQGGTSAADRRAARTAVSALAQTWFVHGDLLEARAEVGSIDCLTALSVTKWVHLHRGDQGLRAFFTRVHSLLTPGGIFILEPQPWKSYRAAADKMRRQGGAELPLPTDSFFRRVGELELRPDGFPDLLQEEFGFKLLRRLQPPEETAEGFDRPVFLFRKI
jgi:7SK snRNA methylphosphate capping enzyme